MKLKERWMVNWTCNDLHLEAGNCEDRSPVPGIVPCKIWRNSMIHNQKHWINDQKDKNGILHPLRGLFSFKSHSESDTKRKYMLNSFHIFVDSYYEPAYPEKTENFFSILSPITIYAEYSILLRKEPYMCISL